MVIDSVQERIVYPDHVEKGVKSSLVDGSTIDGCIIPYGSGKESYEVVVTMGNRAGA